MRADRKHQRVSFLGLAALLTSYELRGDTVIGSLWAVGMALGVIFMYYMGRSVIVPSSYESILFGNMLLIDSTKLLVMSI
ncbi:MAG: metal ABC transporter permease [Candidatus Methanomethylophilaceae archaeon]|nr:metal ABC transporter permease [Candidatus Methanomethylophilaceae archaeon]